MSFVTDIETAIQSLSVAEQRIIALHLGERLVVKEYAGTAVDEGIRFLPRYEFTPAPHASHAQKLRHRAKTTR